MLRVIIILCSLPLVFGCNNIEARRPISTKTGSFIKASIERNKKLNENEINTIKAIIAKSPEKNFINSEHGFWYYYNTKSTIDSLKTPNFGDVVSFSYDIKDLNGNVIYSKEELKNQTYMMDKQEVFPGLREGLKLLKTGEVATFIFPSQMAYGYYGDEKKIGTNVPLVCEITINSIKVN